jgi:hypothetical protein
MGSSSAPSPHVITNKYLRAKLSRHTSLTIIAGTGNMTGRRVAQLEGAGKIKLDRSPMEIIGRPRWLPPVSGRNGTKDGCAVRGASASGHNNRSLLGWRKAGRDGQPKGCNRLAERPESGRCQVKGSHLTLRALHHLLYAEIPLLGHMDHRPCGPWGGKTYFRRCSLIMLLGDGEAAAQSDVGRGGSGVRSCGYEGCGPSVDSLRDGGNAVCQMHGFGNGSKAGSIDEQISPYLTSM